jgi:hypothetical protein
MVSSATEKQPVLVLPLVTASEQGLELELGPELALHRALAVMFDGRPVALLTTGQT